MVDSSFCEGYVHFYTGTQSRKLSVLGLNKAITVTTMELGKETDLEHKTVSRLARKKLNEGNFEGFLAGEGIGEELKDDTAGTLEVQKLPAILEM